MNSGDFQRYKAAITSTITRHAIAQHQAVIKHLKEIEAAAKRYEPTEKLMEHLKELEASAKRLEPSGAMLQHLKQLVAAKIESNEAMAKHVKQLN